MAKQSYGILDGYSGTIGPVIGYQWRGRWCLRARPRRVHNPQTEAQQEHRMLFRDMVQMASRFTPVLRYGLHTASTEEHMTEGNLFVKMNKDCFTPQGIDYEQLQVSAGPVAPVAFTRAEVDEQMVLRTEFERNPLRLRADGDDKVYVYAYCPQQQRGVMSAAAYRRSKRLEMALPDEWAGMDVYFYGFVVDYQQRASETLAVDVSQPNSTQDAEGNVALPCPSLEGTAGAATERTVGAAIEGATCAGEKEKPDIQCETQFG